jgi:hypothetical protein
MTGRRTENVHTYAPAGFAQPREGGGYSRYTDCILTAIWADGADRTPAVLYSFDPRYRTDKLNTKRRREIHGELQAALTKHNIAPERVVYAGKEKGESRTYVAESAALVEHFFGFWKIPEGAVVLSDNGNSVATTNNAEGVTPLISAGFKGHFTFPAAVHQFLSPNDNRLHGAAKQRWRKSGINKNSIESGIRLLADLDASMGGVSEWFNDNMQLDVKRPRFPRVEKLISGVDTSGLEARKDYMDECRFEYLCEIGEDGRGEVAPAPKGLDSALNGKHYMKRAKDGRRAR